MGLRYIFLALALWGVFLIGRHFWRQSRQKDKPSQQIKSVDSVQCAYCGLHLPRDEAVNEDGKYYCSKTHLKAANERKP
ncbi:MAG: PP0621 family protein [Candidatus Thiodiazotropha sp.]